MLRTISIIAFSLLMVSCVHFNGKPSRDWPEPSKPNKFPVEFVTVNIPTNGLFISEENSRNLAKNIDELDGYIAKLEAMIKEMKAYYKAQ